MKYQLSPPSITKEPKINFNELSKAEQIKYVENQIKEIQKSETETGFHAQFKMLEIEKLNKQLKALTN